MRQKDWAIGYCVWAVCDKNSSRLVLLHLLLDTMREEEKEKTKLEMQADARTDRQAKRKAFSSALTRNTLRTGGFVSVTVQSKCSLPSFHGNLFSSLSRSHSLPLSLSPLFTHTCDKCSIKSDYCDILVHRAFIKIRSHVRPQNHSYPPRMHRFIIVLSLLSHLRTTRTLSLITGIQKDSRWWKIYLTTRFKLL